MKVIKKITAIMLSIMMVLGMSSVVSAAETSGAAATTGSITINNAAPGETYNIYRILDLESYNGSGESGNYAYKLRDTTSKWNAFIQSDEIKDVYVTIDGDYVTWKNGVATTEDKAAEFAKKALDYAKINSIAADAGTTLLTTETSATFSSLPLGYYLVETSVGTVLALDTTNSTWTIEDKNVAPTVKKEVSKTENGTYGDESTASIGDTVYFKTTIAAKKGARNYVLHDTMSAGLTFNESSIVVKKEGSATPFERDSDYELVTDTTAKGDSCTFHIKFTESFCKSITVDTNIIVTYSATLNEKAEIGSTTGNTNTTYLKYGGNRTTTESTTTTYTFEIPVLKYTSKGTSAAEMPLANAKFKLSKDENGTNLINLVDITKVGDSDNTYRVAKATEDPSITIITEIVTPDSGKLRIQGLAEGIYYLTETKQPDGYNILKEAIKIVIDKDGGITYGSKSATTLSSMSSGGDVKVLNKSGSLLPSTGGRGTTLFYILGAILVVGSGVVLITKKRMK